jgi:hypothetical protein
MQVLNVVLGYGDLEYQLGATQVEVNHQDNHHDRNPNHQGSAIQILNYWHMDNLDLHSRAHYANMDVL